MRSALWLLPLALVACGGGTISLDDPNNPDGNDPGATFSMRVDSIVLADGSDGFDLDEHATTSSSDPVGCGKVDASGGVDNALAGLSSTLSTFGFDPDASFADAIAGGNLVLDVTISGYHGPDDDLVLVDMVSNGETVATGVEGSVSGDVLSATIAELPLQNEVDGTTYDMTAREVELSLPLTGAPDDASVSGGMLGGGLVWDEAGENDLRGLVLANVPSYLAGTAESLVEGTLDLQPAGTGDCDAMSMALILDASAL